MSPRVLLPQISPSAWEHPDEAKTNAAGTHSASERFRVKVKSKQLRTSGKFLEFLIADAIRVSASQRGRLHEMFVEALQTLDWPEAGAAKPQLYVASRVPFNGAWCDLGDTESPKPVIVLSARVLDVLEADEQRFIVARSVAQLISMHRQQRTAAQSFSQIDTFFAGFFEPRRNGLMRGEFKFSDDRGALLATQDIDSALRTLLKLSGGNANGDTLSTQAWIEQIGEVVNASAAKSGVDGETGEVPNLRLGRLARRALELHRWAHSDAYRDILAGIYPRRSDERAADNTADTNNTEQTREWFVSDDIKDEAREAVNAIGTALDRAADAVHDAVHRASGTLQDRFGVAGKDFTDIVDSARDAFRDAVSEMKNASRKTDDNSNSSTQ